MNLRWLALRILMIVISEGRFIQDAMEQVLKDISITKKERAFIKKLVYGTVEHKLYLDYIINQVSKIKVKKMKPVVRQILRLSVYQLFYMESVPDSAVCNEGVKLIKKRKMFSLAGFINGVLRQIVRKKDTFKLPNREDDPIRFLSLKYSFEEALINLLLESYDIEIVENILEVSNEEAPLTIRVNKNIITVDKLKTLFDEEGIKYKPGCWLDEALRISDYNQIAKIKGFSEGLFQIQDESSMLVAKIGVEETTKKVIDICGAPGGKAIHAGELIGEKGIVKTFDLTQHKIDLIEKNKARLRMDNVDIEIADGTVLDPSLIGYADLVITDVPCSGLGIIRKKPDIKWQMNKEKIDSLVKIQRKILSNAKNYVRKGGTLVYSTCTLTREENQENVYWFLKENIEFILEKIEGKYANEDTGMVQLLPLSNGPDGFFIAKMKRKLE